MTCPTHLAGALSCFAALAATSLEYEHPGCPYLNPSRSSAGQNRPNPPCYSPPRKKPKANGFFSSLALGLVYFAIFSELRR